MVPRVPPGGAVRRSPVVAAVALVAVLVVSCSSGTPQRNLPRGVLTVRTGSGQVTVDVEIAANGHARTVGLMNRPRLAPDAGMVFLFDGPVSGGFWMKNTLIPLSIAFWDDTGRILEVLDMTPCREDPCRVYFPGVTYFGAVEANLGWFEAHGIRPGDRAVLSER